MKRPYRGVATGLLAVVAFSSAAYRAACAPAELSRPQWRRQSNAAQNGFVAKCAALDEVAGAQNDGSGAVADSASHDNAKKTDSSPVVPPDVISLPVYLGLAESAVRRHLGISEEQERKLRAISQAYEKRAESLSRQAPNVPQPATAEELMKRFQEREEQLRRDCRNRIDETLSPKQLNLLKKLVLGRMAGEMLRRPEIVNIIGLTPEQANGLRIARKEAGERSQHDCQNTIDRLLDILDAQQRAQLRAHTEELSRQAIGAIENRLERDNIGGGAAQGSAWADRTEADEPLEGAVSELSALPVYHELARASVREQLGLSASQQSRLQEVARAFHNETEELSKAMRGLTVDEMNRKHGDFLKRLDQAEAQARQQIDGVLNVRQLTMLRDLAFRAAVARTLMETGFWETLRLGVAQSKAFTRLQQESAEKNELIVRSEEEKILGLLRPQQQQTLRKELDRHDWADWW